jgi:hypothetical protein
MDRGRGVTGQRWLQQSILPLRGEMHCFASLAMTAANFTYDSAFPRREFARVVQKLSPLLTTEGARNAGRAMRPQPRVYKKQTHERSHHGHTGTTRHSPRNGFTAYFVLSPVTMLV